VTALDTNYNSILLKKFGFFHLSTTILFKTIKEGETFMHYYLVLTVIALLGATFRIFSKKDRRASRVLRIFLLWILALNVGVTGFIGFIGHTFMAENVALLIGWMPGSPFQFEVAVANLMMGALGFMCLWFEADVWLATIVATTIFGWGAAFGHIRDIMLHQNYSPGNAGAPLYADIIAPVVLIALFVAYKLTKNKTNVVAKAVKVVKAPKKVKKVGAKKTKKK
jgi:hypothetical protein